MRRNCTKIVCVCLKIAALMTLSSCADELQTESSRPPQGVEVGFYAGGAQTRTEMLQNGLSAAWEEGDQLAVWAADANGSYVLSNQIFGTYGIDGQRGFFTSVLGSAMPQGTYTYYCCYPAPTSVSGTSVTFNLPSVQDGKASGGSDIMVATPVVHGALTAVPEPEDHSGMSMQMNRMMHQFRFFIPQDDQLMGDERIERMIMSFPVPVTGNVTLDFADPEAQMLLTEGKADVELELSQPIGVSSGDSYQYACLAMTPVQFESGQSLQIVKALTDDKIAFFDPIDLKGKNCLPGHSTPVMLKVRELVDYAGIIYLKLNTNNLGENPKKITFTAPEGCNWGDGRTNVFVYDPGREIPVGETIAIKFETDVEAYKAFSSKQITVTYDSENALMEETFTMPAIDRQGTTSVNLTVPYLLFEDFSCVHSEGESYGNNSYAAEDRNQPGYLLDGCMSHTGWNASRYWTTGNSMRINTRYQCVSISLLGYTLTFASYHHGRLDTPSLSGLKPGKSVNLKMTFDAGGYYHKSSSTDISDVRLCIATHTNAGALDGVPTGTSGLNQTYESSLNDFGSRQDSHTMTSDFGENDFAATFPTYESELAEVTSSTRIAFYTIFTGSEEFACNAEFNVYIDNIKVQIAQ